MDAVEIAGTECIEVIAEFDGAVVDVRHLDAEPYTVGTDARVSFVVADGTAAATLVRRDELGRFFVRAAEGERALFAGEHVALALGNTTFHFANVPAPLRHGRPMTFSDLGAVYVGAVAFAASLFLCILYSIPPSPKSLALDLSSGEHFARFLIVPPEELAARAETSGRAPGSASSGERGRLGKPAATATRGVRRLPGPVSHERVMASARAAAERAGVLGQLRALDGTHAGALFGPGNPLGDDAPLALAGLAGTALDDGYGAGTQVVGHGPGGGGDPTVPLGELGPGGGGTCDAACRAGRWRPKAGVSGLGGHRAGAPEDPTSGSARVIGTLDKEIIRRVIRRHRNEIRFCYELGLQTRPELAGRVVAQFTIAGNGRVLGAAVAETSLASASVEECITRAVRRWEFPSSPQVSVVSYPFVLSLPR